MPVELFMPKMSDHMEKGTILKWLVEEGTTVTERQPVLEIETDKVVAEVEAPASGILVGVRAQAGVEVPVGEIIAFIVRPGESAPEAAPLQAPTARPGVARRVPAAEAAGDSELVKASPAARKLARERGIDLRMLRGTGPAGRITQEDVLAYSTAPASQKPGIEAEDVDWQDLSSAKRITGERLTWSWQNVPHFTLSLTVDMSKAVSLREMLQHQMKTETGYELSYTALLVSVVAAALKDHPLANAEFCEGRIKVHRQVNVGIAVNTDEGLLVPVIRGADKLHLGEIARELEVIRKKAATRGFVPDDLIGGTFTISNLGMHGVESFSAIINPPQSAVLAVGGIVRRPSPTEEATMCEMRPVMSLTLSVDHRVLDGVAAAAFLSSVKRRLENPNELL